MKLSCKWNIALKVEQLLYLTDVMIVSTAALLVILLHCNIIVIIHRGAVLLNICLNILAASNGGIKKAHKVRDTHHFTHHFLHKLSNKGSEHNWCLEQAMLLFF